MSGLYTDPMLDALGTLIREVRADTDVSDLVDVRVRGFEPAPPVYDPNTKQLIALGDARDPGHYIAFIVLTTLAGPPEVSIPVTFMDVGARCYGVTAQNAWAVYGALVKAVHRVGARMNGTLGIYQSLVTGGGDQDRDPDTKQPLVHATIRLIAATIAIA